MHMKWFEDFDAWGSAVTGAHLRLACDGVETRAWGLGIVDLDGVVLQIGSEGGGTLCYGVNAHTGPLLFVPLIHAGAHVGNGRALDDDSLLLIPHGADFSIRVRRRAHAWLSVALPADTVIDRDAGGGSGRHATPPGTVAALRRVSQTIAQALLGQPPGSPAHRAARAELLAAAHDCLASETVPPMVTGRPRLDRAQIIRRSMDAIDAAPILPTVTDLVTIVGVNSRTLLRTFQETFGMPPKRYLMLRELHAVRRLLTTGVTLDTTVAEVLVRNGIWEFGRFAGRYRRQFGEFPSETLRRAQG
ncbi:MAG: AraC family transcriptional regulator [Planctomycetes bacterium]|nr:AraC family transcriptional regulator [Planctomycetota bacterium]